jgi:hypothetical protein
MFLLLCFHFIWKKMPFYWQKCIKCNVILKVTLGAITLCVTAFCTMTLGITINMWHLLLMPIDTNVEYRNYADYVQCRYAECHFADCQGTLLDLKVISSFLSCYFKERGRSLYSWPTCSGATAFTITTLSITASRCHTE